MLNSRRKFLTSICSVAAYSLSLATGLAHASLENIQWIQKGFGLDKYDETIEHLFKGAKLIDNHNKIKFEQLPHVAENGAVVPIKIISSFKKITKIYIFVEKNPHPLSAEFNMSPSVVAEVSARLRMAETSPVTVIVEADSKFYRKTKKVKVAIGGCGG